MHDAEWLQTADFKEIQPYQERYKRFFFKEFSLENPAGFKNASLFLYPENDCELNINDQWVKQEIVAGTLNKIDITGYVRKGNNMLFLAFPFVEGKSRFAARVIVEYYNYDRVEFTSDKSWLTVDMYTNPSLLRKYDRPGPPTIVSPPGDHSKIIYKGFEEWDIQVPRMAFDKMGNTVLHLSYKGDRAELYNDHHLSADDFNNNTVWRIGLNRQEYPVEGRTLRLVIYPLSEKSKIFFDNPPATDGYNKAAIDNFKVKPYYKTKINQQ